MSAKCHFLNASPSYYDQTNTLKAINMLELFISIYPNSENVLEANDLISKLNLILEEKASILHIHIIKQESIMRLFTLLITSLNLIQTLVF